MSLSHVFHDIEESSLLLPGGYHLREASSLSPSPFFEELLPVKKKRKAEKRNSPPQKERATMVKETGQNARKDILMNLFICKLWECLKLSKRYSKMTTFEIDCLGEDISTWENIFDVTKEDYLSKEEKIVNQRRHVVRHKVWRKIIHSEKELPQFPSESFGCYSKCHCVSVCFNNGIVDSQQTPMTLTLYEVKITSVHSKDSAGLLLIDSNIRVRYKLISTFKTSCSLIGEEQIFIAGGEINQHT